MLGTPYRDSAQIFLKSFYVWLDRHILCGCFTIIRPFLGFFPLQVFKYPQTPLIFAPRVHSKNSNLDVSSDITCTSKQDAHFQKSCLHILNCQWMVTLSWNKHKSLEWKKVVLFFSWICFWHDSDTNFGVLESVLTVAIL